MSASRAEILRKLALDAIDLFLEYRDKHGKTELEAREAAANEVWEAYELEENNLDAI